MENKLTITKKEMLYYIAIILYFTSLMFEKTQLQYHFDRILQVLRYGAYALFVAKILWESKYKKNKVVLWVLLLALFVVQATIKNGKELCFLLLILLAGQGMDISKTFALIAMVQLCCIVVIFGLCGIGIFDNFTILDHGVIRNGMGFNYVTLPGETLFAAILAWCFYRKEQLKFVEVILG